MYPQGFASQLDRTLTRLIFGDETGVIVIAILLQTDDTSRSETCF